MVIELLQWYILQADINRMLSSQKTLLQRGISNNWDFRCTCEQR
jgi:hypothetical protein